METYLAPTATDEGFINLSLDALLTANDVGHEWRLQVFKNF